MAHTHRYRSERSWRGSTGAGYVDSAEGEIPQSPRPMRITRIVPRPRITIRGAEPIEKVEPEHWNAALNSGKKVNEL